MRDEWDVDTPNYFYMVKSGKSVVTVSKIYLGTSSGAMALMDADWYRWERLGYEVKVFETLNEAEITGVRMQLGT